MMRIQRSHGSSGDRNGADGISRSEMQGVLLPWVQDFFPKLFFRSTADGDLLRNLLLKLFKFAALAA